MTAGARIGWVDLLRGLAVVGMVSYHAAWDLHAFGMTAVDPGVSLPWRLLGHGIAASFLFLSGLGLVLAHERGVRLGGALRRIAWIAAAALLVTAGTYVFARDEVIGFGILHCIAVANLAALPLLTAPTPLLLGFGAAGVALPALAPDLLPAGWWWTGLSTTLPNTLDYQPFLPAFGFVLFGTACGRLRNTALGRRKLWPDGHLSRITQLAGRHSLVIYLVHQPLMVGLLGAATGRSLHSAGPDQLFVPACVATCWNDMPSDSCETVCRCVAARLVELGPGADRDPDRTSAATTACAATLLQPGLTRNRR